MNPIPIGGITPQQTPTLTIDQALQQAVAYHNQGQLQEAERMYRAILQAQPNHPNANHNLGVLAVQVKQPVAALPHFRMALEANPNQGQYWVSYIDALIQASQIDVARQVLVQGKQMGLNGTAVEALAARLGQFLRCEPSQQEMKALITLFGERRYMEVVTLAQTMTERYPQHGFGWKVLGAALKQTGRNVEALEASKRAVELLPGDANAHSNLGESLQDNGCLKEAMESYRLALQIRPDYFEVHFNLGNALRDDGQLGEAIQAYRRALEIKPDNAEAYYNLGNVLRDQGLLDDAVANYQRALEVKSDFLDVYCNLGGVFLDQGKLSEALSCFQQQVSLDPENGVIQHLIASLEGQNTECAPAQYVERLFDGYANRFDSHLLQKLKYETPEKLVALVKEHVTPSPEKWNVLDLGCGTGLVGSAISPLARQLIGVDLSAKMLEKARARNVYQRLEHLDLLTMMRREEASSCDVIIAADVFVYLGRLDEIVNEIKRLLCPGGLVAFSIEALGDTKAGQGAQREYMLEHTGRYAHAANYITRLAVANGFRLTEMAATTLRMERGSPVNGHLVLWKK